MDTIKKEVTPDSIQLHNNINFIKNELRNRGIFEVVQPNFNYQIDSKQSIYTSTSYDFFPNSTYIQQKDESIGACADEEIYKVTKYDDNKDYSQYVNLSKVDIDSLECSINVVPRIEVDSDKESYHAENYFQLSSIPRDLDLPTSYFDKEISGKKRIFSIMILLSTFCLYNIKDIARGINNEVYFILKYSMLH